MKLGVSISETVDVRVIVLGACGKRCYDSKRAALMANRTNGHTLRVYRCNECDAYHVTKQRCDW